jgi:hypothetical protein
MGKPDWFWQAIAAAACQYPLYGGFEVNPVTDGNVDRLDSGPGPQRCPYRFILIYNLGVTARLFTRFFMCTAQQRFSTTNGWRIQKEAKVRSNSHSPGVGNAMTIDQQEVRVESKLFTRRQYRWRFPE